jgi:hypothetical protein
MSLDEEEELEEQDIEEMQERMKQVNVLALGLLSNNSSLEQFIEAYNAIEPSHCNEIGWIGPYVELLEGNSEFALEMRECFRTETNSTETIKPDEEEDFGGFAMIYRL